MGNKVLVDKAEGVGYIILNRPEALNALDLEMTIELAAALEEYESDEQVRAVVVTGKGKAFCAGGDLHRMLAGGPSKVLRELTFHFNRAILGIRRLPKPVLAAVNGATAGGGMSLAMACDLRIAGRSAKFRQAYTTNGLVPDGGWSVWATALLGLAKASELVLMDPLLDSAQALAAGLVSRVVEDDELEETARGEARRLAAGATFAYGRAKALLNEAALPNLAVHLEREREAMAAAGASHDGLEGIKSFLERRAPQYTGR